MLNQSDKNINHLTTRPMLDGSDRVWTDFSHWWFNQWFMNEISWQPTLFKKIKKWLELEYKWWLTPKGVGLGSAKVPTPLSIFYWNIIYRFPNVDWEESIKNKRIEKYKDLGEY